MALVREFDFGGRIVVSGAYEMIIKYSYAKLSGSLTFTTAAFKDKETRDEFAANKAELNARQAEVKRLSDEMAEMIKSRREDGKPDLDSETTGKRLEVEHANTLVSEMATVMNGGGVIPNSQEDHLVPPEDAIAMVNEVDGTIDVAAVYAWLKSRPGREGAVDA